MMLATLVVSLLLQLKIRTTLGGFYSSNKPLTIALLNRDDPDSEGSKHKITGLWVCYGSC
jgi:hypothetical protein